MQERRRYVRWPINSPILYHPDNSEDEFSCLANNISIRGIGLSFTEKIDNRSTIFITIPTKDSKPISFKAEVMWQEEESKSGLYRTGLYFTNLKQQDRDKILSLTQK